MKLADRLKMAVESSGEQEKKEIITGIGQLVISENQKENEYLIKKTLEILNIQAKASLELGRVFNDVIKNVEENTYCKWLEINGYNKTTAFRHRRRHSLYEKVSTKNAKEIVALCTFRELDKIFKDEEKYLEVFKTDINYLDLKEMLKEGEIKAPQISNFKPIELSSYKNIFSRLDEKIDSLDEKRKQELQKYLEKIEKILDGIK